MTRSALHESALHIKRAVRIAALNILGPRLTALLRQPSVSKLDPVAEYRSHLRLRRGLEIGGPSELMKDEGPIPIYDILGSLDNCLYSGSTLWTGEVREEDGFLYHPAKQAGRQIICDAADLRCIPDSSYECVLACHCLEHIANPLRALAEWKRVLKDEGLLLLVLPHKDGTFDWRRPTTTLAHMIKDYENAVSEEDLTHVPEVLELHDLSRDEGVGTKEQFRQRCLANRVHRALHHHVFDTMAALSTVDCAGLQILRLDNLKPLHIIILASRTSRSVDNRRFMEKGSEHWSRSPFPSDRGYAKG